MGNSDSKSQDDCFLQKLTEIIRNNFDNEQFGVKEAARIYGVSRSHMHRRLKKLTGKSVSQFIRELRLEKSMELLQKDMATVSEIAYSVGFHSPTYFNTCFKEYFGFTPGEAKIREHLQQERPKFEKSGNQKMKFTLASVILFLILLYGYFQYNSLWTKPPIDTPTTSSMPSSHSTKSIVVLPLKNWSGDPKLEYISDGMTDAVISRISEIREMDRVVPFTSSLQFKNSEKSLPELAKALKVFYILEGNFQKQGNLFKINLRLNDGPLNKLLWSGSYSGEWKANEIFEIQSKVAEKVATIMNVKLTEKDYDAFKGIPTKNEEAYNYYLLAKYQNNKFNQSSFKNAIPLYEKALDLDSTFIEPYLGLADIYVTGGAVWGMYGEQEAWRNAKYYLEKASLIDGDNIQLSDQLHIGKFYFDWNFEAVEQYVAETSARLGADNWNEYLFVDYYLKTGKYSYALSELNKLILEDPSYGWLFAIRASVIFFVSSSEEAKEDLEQYDPLFMDDMFYLREAAKWYYYFGAYDASKEKLEQLMNNFTDRPPIVVWLNALHYEMANNIEGVQESLTTLQKQFKEGSSGSPAWFMALYYCHIQNRKEVFNWLQKSYKSHEVEMTWLRAEPLLAPYRQDPMYLDLYKKMKFPVPPLTIPD
ncbi:helix-turn-helix domain-containing protein [Arenibacter sp. S6351L]|uniref:helix-turn-helix domain-containing protein n=1 Tax=Arenibacter sp. S6351L TaxID=2926407 RepID=UPI001FF2FC64|nr:helix-turn-helix domain-containing protein [Arenibacter sp. S6351L]MCK0133587.1 helix-turn-helix domain-containing protein [Arenibacter sp. S6351L]